MTICDKKKIIKGLISKPHSIKIIYPPGFSDVASQEVHQILENLWAAKPFAGKILLLKNEIRIQGIYLYAMLELLLRSKCLTDIRLIIANEKSIGIRAFEKACRAIPWLLYLSPSAGVKINVNSISSQAFHEGALKDILTNVINDSGIKVDNHDETHSTINVFAELYKNKLILSISLAGDPLYKRGYRDKLIAHAPLREDFATCLIQKALTFARKIMPNFNPKQLIIPFSGTGTFAFEYLINHFNILPSYFEREYAIQKMPFFKKEHFIQIIKKSYDKIITQLIDLNILSMDISNTANQVFTANTHKFESSVIKHGFSRTNLKAQQANFLEQEIDFEKNDTFMMLNPPYGIRLAKHHDSVILYKKIAIRINTMLKSLKKSNSHLLGLILCPTQDTWSIFMNELTCTYKETYHFTQGGLDIRVCQFYE